MVLISDILKTKGDEYSSVSPDTIVFDALKKMVANNIGSILIVDNGKIVGIFTERDYLRLKVLEDLSTKDTKIGVVMTKDPITIESKLICSEALKLMTDNKCRHLPVVDDGKIVGIVSIGDLVSKKLKEQGVMIDQLSGYVSND